MSSPVFNELVAIILRHEGGLVDDPRDPGGITNYGISLRAYPSLGRAGIRALTPDSAAALYEKDYWAPIHGDELPPPVALVVFDAAVNSGIRRASGWLQKALGVSADGRIGPVTVAAVNDTDPVPLCRDVCDLRIEFLEKLSGFDHFGAGWTRRVNDTLDKAVALARA